MKLSVTDLAVAARCPRQMVLSREGLRVVEGDGGIGQTAHAVLAGFVRAGGEHPAMVAALAKNPPDEVAILAATVEALYRELYDRAPALAPSVAADDLVRLGRIVFQLASLVGELLLRARRAGVAPAFARSFEAAERPVELTLDGGEVEVGGQIDLLCRDVEAREAYVVDLKTHLADAAAEEQVRLYALALARSGEKFSPALVCAPGDALELHRVPPLDQDGERALDERAHSLRLVLEGQATPAAAPSSQTCRTCAVQSACWSRWGRTIEEPGPEQVATGELAEEALRLEKSLRAHRVHLERIDPGLAIAGPNVVRFLISLREGETISRVERAARDLQRAMSWAAPPLVQNEGHFVAVDAPRRDREVLPWRAVPLEELRGLEVPVGLTLSRELLKLDLAAAPHLLVAGATNSGKSVFLKGLVLSLLRRAQVAIVDPKMLDFPPFNALPLWRPVITDPQQAVALLQELIDEELPRRRARLQKAGVTQRSELPEGAPPMPPLVVVIDEFADLLAMYPDRASKTQFLGGAQRLLQTARAVGIHLVIATQRPSVDAVPGQLKANLPVRIAFKLPGPHDSGTVLDEGGAENLLGRGDLLLKRDGQLVRAQAFNVTADDVAAARA